MEETIIERIAREINNGANVYTDIISWEESTLFDLGKIMELFYLVDNDLILDVAESIINELDDWSISGPNGGPLPGIEAKSDYYEETNWVELYGWDYEEEIKREAYRIINLKNKGEEYNQKLKNRITGQIDNPDINEENLKLIERTDLEKSQEQEKRPNPMLISRTNPPALTNEPIPEVFNNNIFMDDQKVSRMYLILQNVSNKITSIETSSNVSIALLKSDMLNSWHSLNMAYKKFVEVRDINNIEDVLDSKYFKEEYANLRGRINTIISDQFDFFRDISQEEDCYCDLPIEVANIRIKTDKNAVINEYTEIIKSKNNSILNDFCDKEYTGYFYNDIEREFIETGSWSQFEYEQSKNADIGFTQVLKSLDVFKKAWDILSAFDDFVIKDRGISIEDYKRALTNRVRSHSIQYGDIMLKELQKLIKKYKINKSHDPTPEMWGDMLEGVETVISQCINTGFVDGSLFNNDIQFTQSMSQNPMLLKAFSDCSIDTELFNIDDSVTDNSPLLTYLTKFNLVFFLKLVLRTNLIKCEMKPQLKKEYTLWLGIDEGGAKSTTESTDPWLSALYKIAKLDYTKNDGDKEALINHKGDWYYVMRAAVELNKVKSATSYTEFIKLLPKDLHKRPTRQNLNNFHAKFGNENIKILTDKCIKLPDMKETDFQKGISIAKKFYDLYKDFLKQTNTR